LLQNKLFSATAAGEKFFMLWSHLKIGKFDFEWKIYWERFLGVKIEIY
jgi:hypothetical protein